MPEVVSEGKPTLFFTAHQADQDWRLKEKIVAVIESYFQERDDIYTFSSAKIKDVVGSLEEVDVAYASLQDPTAYFSFIEVRDRRNKVGRPYIQEIMGKRTSLALESCKVVSTKGFSETAIRLASKQDISLRLLLPETAQNIKRWFKPDGMPIDRPLFRIVKSSVLVVVGNKTLEFKAGQKKVLENNILVPTDEPGRYKVISLSRVFQFDFMQEPGRGDQLLAKVPRDGMYHKTSPVSIVYEKPRLYLRVKKPIPDAPGKNGAPIYPINAIVFFAELSRPSTFAKITKRYKYIDAVSNEKIAELFLASAKIKQKRYYVCLMRYNCDVRGCNLGGAFFL